MAGSRASRGGGGLSLQARFALAMTISLAVVMAAAGWVIHQTTSKLIEDARTNAIETAVRATANEEVEGRPVRRPHEGSATQGILRAPLSYGPDAARERGTVYQALRGKEPVGEPLLVPDEDRHQSDRILRLMAGITILIIVVGAVVALVVSGQVTKPLVALVDDVRQIARGNLRHRTRVRGGGEVASLARAIDRMSGELQEAQEAEVELGMRERELEVASEVREALLPQATPEPDGWELASLHVASEHSGGDLHDFIEHEDGSVGVLVCDVSGAGIPGALVGATARSYLRSELARDADVAAALRRVNRYLAGDVRRGMYVTALYVRLSPGSGSVEVACAGHKLPLVRCSAGGEVRLVQPEGIALGFDRGPVFDRALDVQTIEVDPGDRLVLSGAGIAGARNPAGEELGERAFYNLARKLTDLSGEEFLDALVTAVEAFADGEPFPSDLSIVSVARIQP